MLKLGLWLQGFHLEFDLCPAVFFNPAFVELSACQFTSIVCACVCALYFVCPITLTLTPSQRLLISPVAFWLQISFCRECIWISLFLCVCVCPWVCAHLGWGHADWPSLLHEWILCVRVSFHLSVLMFFSYLKMASLLRWQTPCC